MSEKRVRVALWGTGHVGSAALKEVLRTPEYELVAVRVYSEDKHGRDAAELVGLPACGVKASQDVEALFAAQPDCVIYTAKDIGQFTADRDLMELLSRGVNVVTALPYHYLAHRRNEAVPVEQLRAAAVAGGATLYAGGENPGVALERIGFTATGGCTSMKSIRLIESLRVGSEPEDVLRAFGFGKPEVEARSDDSVRLVAEQYFGQSVFFLTDAMGIPVDRIGHDCDMRVATEVVTAPNGMTIQPGEVEFVAHSWSGRPEGGPVVTTTVQWYLDDEHKPAGVLSQDFHEIAIEATPSYRLTMEWHASLESGERFHPGDPVAPIYYATAVPLVQAVASTVAAHPGIRLLQPPANAYWRRDMREPLVARTA